MKNPMAVSAIMRHRTEIGAAELLDILEKGSSGIHESLFRSYHIVLKTKELLSLNTPPAVVLEMIELMDGFPLNKANQGES
jgi:hypothetical protein